MLLYISCIRNNHKLALCKLNIASNNKISLPLDVAVGMNHPLEKVGISLFKEEIMGISGRYDKVLETFLAEHENVAEKQGMNLMDVLLEAKGDEKSEYKITRDQIKALFVVNRKTT
ncbi:hypothetical protein YC2023_037732 [Brassica napus]